MKIFQSKSILYRIIILIGSLFLLVLSLFVFHSKGIITGNAADSTSLLQFYLYGSNSYAVIGCDSSATNITIPSMYNGKPVTRIEGRAFENCGSLTSVTIGNNVTSIGSCAFRDCGSLTSVAIGNNVMSIEDGVFYNCSALTRVTIPNGVTSVEVSLFENCRSLTSVTIPNSVTRIMSYAFSGCSSLEEIKIPSSVTSIGENAFKDCNLLRSVNLPDGLSIISKRMFMNCYKLSSIKIPTSVTSIGEGALRNCAFEEIVISDNVTSIGYRAFVYTTSLSKIIYYGSSEQWGNIVDEDIGIESSTQIICLGDDAHKSKITFSTNQARGFNIVDNVYYTNGDVTVENFSGYFFGKVGGNIYKDETLLYWFFDLAELPSKTFSEEGNYVFRIGITNEFDSKLALRYEIVIDKTAPQDGIRKTTSETGFKANWTNGDVSLMWWDSTNTATVDGKPYVKDTKITTEGNHKFKLSDLAGNVTEFPFNIDKTVPTIAASTTQSGGFKEINGSPHTNGTVTLSDRDNTNGSGIYERYLNDVLCSTTPAPISEEGVYKYEIIDYAGNRRSYSFRIVKTAPRCLLDLDNAYYDFLEGNYTNQNVIIYQYSHPIIVTAKLNGVSIEFGHKVTTEGTYTVVVTDEVGNSSSESFVIDKTPPQGTLSGLTNGLNSNRTVTFTWDSREQSTATLNGESYSSGSPITNERRHEIYLTDRAGNRTSYSFIIDKTAPTGELSTTQSGGFRAGNYTSGDVTFTWRSAASGESSVSASINGISVGNKWTVYREDSYSVIISDMAGNSTSYTFVIDKTKPQGTLSGVENGGYTNKNVSLSWAPATTSEAPIAATLNGNEYVSGTTVRDEGSYTAVLTDRAGNSSSYTFVVDKTAPVGILSGVANGGFTKTNVSLSWTGATSREAPISATLNGSAYSSGVSISAENEYSLILSDRAGNSTSYTFVVDKTSPTGTLSTTQSGGFRKENYTNGNVSFLWSETIGGTGSQRVNGKDMLTATYAWADFGEASFGAERAYTRTALSAEGRYRVTLTDQAGNSTSYSFIIDKTAPTLIVAGEAAGVNAVYKNQSELSYTDRGSEVVSVSAVQKAVSIDEAGLSIAATAQAVPLIDGSKLSQGEYTVTLTDKAGNVKVTSFLCVGAVYSVNYESLTHSGFLAAGTYRVVIPYRHSITVPAVGKDGRENRYAGRYSNSITYIFSSYENALEFMKEVEIEENVTVNAAGLYTYYQLNNHNTKTTYGDSGDAKASMKEFYQAVEKYSAPNVKEYYAPSLTSPYVGDNTVVVDMDAIANTTQSGTVRIGGDYKFASNTLTQSGYSYRTLACIRIEHNGSEVYQGALSGGDTFLSCITKNQQAGGNGGEYFVTEYDSVGNEFRYAVYFDTMAPTFRATYEYFRKYTDEQGNMQSELMEADIVLESNEQIDANLKSLVISELFDNSDDFFNVIVEAPNGERVRILDIANLSFGVGMNFTAGGNYRISVYDRSGNLFDYAFTLYGGAPRVSTYITGTGDNRTITVGFANANAYSSIVQFEIYRYGDKLPEGEYREEVDGVLLNTLFIDQSTWEYKFFLGGIYTIRFCDSFSCVTVSEEIIFTKGLPTYTLSGVENGGITRRAVSLTFAQSIGYEIRKDGAEFSRASGTSQDGQKLSFSALQAENGYYEIKLFRKTDVKAYVKVSFTIDTVAPTVEARLKQDEIAAWNSTVKEPFRISWFDDDVAKIRYSRNGEYPVNYITGTYFDLDGEYEIIATDNAGNSASWQITLDTVANYNITFSGIKIESQDQIFVGKSFTIVNREWLDLSITRDGTALENAKFDTEYFAEGSYVITLTDAVGNSACKKIIIDKTPPHMEVMQEDKYSSVEITFDASDVAAMTVRKGGKRLEFDITGELTLTEWGEYVVELKDALGNLRSYAAMICKRPPVIKAFTASGQEIESGKTVNESLYFVWDEPTASGRIKLNNGISKKYEPNTVLVDEGNYELIVTDEAGNKVTALASIQKHFSYAVLDASGEKLTTVMLGDKCATNASFLIAKIDEVKLHAEKDGEKFEYAFGQVIGEDGLYTFVLSDPYGNTERYEILRKTTPPEIRIGERETDSESVLLMVSTAKEIKLTVKAAAVTKKSLNPDVEYEFSEWGYYQINAADELGNVSTVEFEIKKLPPVLLAYTVSDVNVKEADRVNEGVTLSCEAGASIRYSLDGGYFKIYKENFVLSEEGAYKVTATDEAGNQVELSFYIDCGINLTAIADGKQIAKGVERITAAKYIELTMLEALEVVCSGAELEEIMSNDVIRLEIEGAYEFIFSDDAGNSATIYIVIDSTPPTCIASVSDNAVTKDDVLISVNPFEVASYKLLMNGKPMSKFILTENNVFTEAGEYELTLVDELGNSVQKTFTIKRAVDYSLSIPNGFIAQKVVTLAVRDKAAVKALLNGEELETELIDGKYQFTAEGVYELGITDEVGNSVSLKFVIDPSIYKKEFAFDIPVGSSLTLIKDGKEILADKYITGNNLKLEGDGEYRIKLLSGGKSAEYKFIIDTQMPTLSINGVEYAEGAEIGSLKKDFTLSANKKNCEIEVYFNGEKAEFASGDKLSANGEYKVVVRDNVGNVVTYEFEKEFTFNAGSIVFFVVCGMLVLLVIAIIVRHRIKMRIR